MLDVVMPFDGKRIEAVRDEQGNLWVGVRSICNAVGIEWSTQYRKIIADSRLTRCHMKTVAADGKNRETFCIPLNQLNGWLFSINPNKVLESIKPGLIAYQQECFNVLYNHFIPRGELDLERFMDRFDRLERKIDQLAGVAETIFGNDKDEITQLIEACAKMHNVDGRTVWGWVQTNCDVGSYKRQNNKIKNYLKNLLGKGLKLVKEE